MIEVFILDTIWFIWSLKAKTIIYQNGCFNFCVKSVLLIWLYFKTPFPSMWEMVPIWLNLISFHFKFWNYLGILFMGYPLIWNWLSIFNCLNSRILFNAIRLSMLAQKRYQFRLAYQKNLQELEINDIHPSNIIISFENQLNWAFCWFFSSNSYDCDGSLSWRISVYYFEQVLSCLGTRRCLSCV